MYITVLLLAAVLGVGLLLGMYFPNQDVYPFSSWSLYHVAPGTRVEFMVLVHPYEAQKFDPPISLEDANARGFLKEYNSPTAYWKGIQRLGAGLERNQQQEVAKERIRLEDNFRSKDVEYEILKISYDPLEYWKTKKFKIIKRMGRFAPPPEILL